MHCGTVSQRTFPYYTSAVLPSIHMAASLDTSTTDLTSQGGTRTASSPFDKPSADLILRSSDGVDFRVFKWILSDASEVFAGMFSLPTPPLEHTDGTTSTSPGHIHQSSPPPVVPVTEHSRALEALLRLCYPLCVVPDYAQFEDLKPVVAAAHKYQVAHALRILEPRMQFFAVQDPVRVYAFATRYNLQDVARDAARNFLFAPDILVDAPELADISAAAYHRLLAYRWRCNLDVILELKALPPRSSFPSPKGTPWVWENCSYCDKHYYDEDGRNCVAKWFHTFYGSLMDVLSESYPLNIITFNSAQLTDTAVQAAATQCNRCGSAGSTRAQLELFLTLAKDDVKRRVATRASLSWDAQP